MLTSVNWKILSTLVKNIRAKRLNRSMIGYSLENTPAPLCQEDFLVFARATRDRHYLAHADDTVAPPLYLAKLMVPMLMDICFHKGLHMNLLRMVHASQEIRWHKPMGAGTILNLRMSIASIEDTPVGEKITLSGQAFAGGNLTVEGRIGLIIRTKTKPFRASDGVQDRLQEAFRTKVRTGEDQSLKYAAVSGDRNLIHTHQLFAKLAGLPQTIMHGACMLAMYCAKLAHHVVDDDLRRLTAIRGRFGRPAFPGQTYELVGYRHSKDGEIPFEVFAADNIPVFRRGLLTYS